MPDSPETTPHPAATIIIMREIRNVLEVFMLVRHEQIEFASGALVFPGGKVDPQDNDELLIPCLDNAAKEPNKRALQVAGIRETFEECGLLLAREKGSNSLISAERLQSLAHYRQALHSGDISLVDFLHRENLQLACDELVHFGNWVTPPFKRRRFDTHFFVAPIPADHFAEHDGTESVDSVWITPADALAQAESDERLVLFPTLANLERLGRHATAGEAVVAARNAKVVPVIPWIEERPDGRYLRISDTAGYTMTEEKIRRPL